MNRSKLEVTITIDNIVHERVTKYIKKKGISFDDYTNRVLESKMDFIKIQSENYWKQQEHKKEFKKNERDRLHRKFTSKAPVFLKENEFDI